MPLAAIRNLASGFNRHSPRGERIMEKTLQRPDPIEASSVLVLWLQQTSRVPVSQ